LRRAPRDLCVCFPSSARRPVGRQVEHGLSRPCSRPPHDVRQHRPRSRSLPRSSPVRPTSRSRMRHPDGPCSAFWADQHGDPFTLLCCSHVREQPAFVSPCSGGDLPRARRHPRQDGNSFAPGTPPLSQVRLRRALCSVWARESCSARSTAATAALDSRLPVRPACCCFVLRASFALDTRIEHLARSKVKRPARFPPVIHRIPAKSPAQAAFVTGSCTVSCTAVGGLRSRSRA
jgi:hypothetical protein